MPRIGIRGCPHGTWRYWRRQRFLCRMAWALLGIVAIVASFRRVFSIWSVKNNGERKEKNGPWFE